MFVQQKTHPSTNEYHSIADGNKVKPIMWQVTLKEGKYRPKDANSKPCFLKEFESHSKTSTLMLYMTKPKNKNGKVIMIDIGCCIAVGIFSLNDVSV